MENKEKIKIRIERPNGKVEKYTVSRMVAEGIVYKVLKTQCAIQVDGIDITDWMEYVDKYGAGIGM